MKASIKPLIRRVIRSTGYDIVRNVPSKPTGAAPAPAVSAPEDPFADLTLTEKEILARVKPFTMTSEARIAGLIQAVTYVSKNSIPGPLVECGVWRGGSMMAAALTLKALGDTDRDLWLYDTFEGMTQPGTDDVRFDGQTAQAEMVATLEQGRSWCQAGLEDVKANLGSTGYPGGKMHFIKGKVEETIPASAPKSISLLRLDTDWYASTRHELEHLFPLLHPHGVLVIDDYGHWGGAKKAVDEYFERSPVPVYLHRLDYTGRMLVGHGGKCA